MLLYDKLQKYVKAQKKKSRLSEIHKSGKKIKWRMSFSLYSELLNCEMKRTRYKEVLEAARTGD